MNHVDKSESGFTLVEVLVTISLIGILTAIVGFTGLKSGTDAAEHTSVTRELVSDLRLLRAKAMSENKRYGIDTSEQTNYKLYEVDIVPEPDNIIVFKTVNLNRGIKIKSGNVSRFHFTPNGNINKLSVKINVYNDVKINEIKVNALGTVTLDN